MKTPLNIKLTMIALLLFSLAGLSQESSIRIKLKADTVIVTDWIKLVDNQSFSKPFIRIDQYNGPTIRLQDIYGYEGTDQNGIHRRLTTYYLEEEMEFRYTESQFEDLSTDAAKIIRHNQYFVDDKHKKKSSVVKYSLQDERVKELTYKNLLDDFKAQGYMNKDMKKARQIKTVQYLASGLGACFFAGALIENASPGSKDFLNGGNIILLSASGVLISIPFMLDKPRKQHVMNAVRNY